MKPLSDSTAKDSAEADRSGIMATLHADQAALNAAGTNAVGSWRIAQYSFSATNPPRA